MEQVIATEGPLNTVNFNGKMNSQFCMYFVGNDRQTFDKDYFMFTTIFDLVV